MRYRPLCRCVKIATKNGGLEFGFTDHDLPLTMDREYIPERAFDATATENSVNLRVNNLTTRSVIGIKADEITGIQLSGGLLDEARITVAIIDWTSPPTDILCGDVILNGLIGKVTSTSGAYNCEVRSEAISKLNTNRSFRLSPTCEWDFGSVQCGFDLTTVTFNHTVLTASSRVSITINETITDRQFDGGKIIFTSGELSGTSWQIAINQGNTYILRSPLPKLPAMGDALTAIRGCSKRYDDGIRGCRAYGQQAFFGGIPRLDNQWMRGNDFLTNPAENVN